MPILVKCDCGHEITVADTMAGKKGRCPECDAILSIPRKGVRRPRGGAFTPAPRDRGGSYRTLSFLASLLGLLGVLGLAFYAALGVYTGVTIFRSAEAFSDPLGLFAGYQDLARDRTTLTGIGFIVGGLFVGCLTFIFLCSTAQVIRLFVSLERSLLEITDRLSRRD